ncbi:MAG: hypothetical protein WCS43_08715, partial [Verrucomicrobiota bacterium]
SKLPEQMQLLASEQASAASVIPRILSRPQKTLQELHLKESLAALNQAEATTQISELRDVLASGLPQNSEITRLRYADSLIKWFFRDGLNGFSLSAWRAYRDFPIQAAIHRYLYLSSEPIMAASVATVLPRLQEGIIVPSQYLITNTEKAIGHDLVALSRKRLLSSLRKLGFLEKSTGADRVAVPLFNGTAALLCLHHAFSVESVRTIEVSQIEENPFWYYMGLRNADQLRDFLRAADHAGLIGKYVVADRLEQITTSFTWRELIERGARL